jgi:hypothetical protein
MVKDTKSHTGIVPRVDCLSWAEANKFPTYQHIFMTLALNPQLPTLVSQSWHNELLLIEQQITDIDNNQEKNIEIKYQLFCKIQSNDLWQKSGYRNLKSYIVSRWKYQKSQAYNHARAARTADFLLKSGAQSAPNYAQSLQIARFPKSERTAIWFNYCEKGIDIPQKEKKVSKKVNDVNRDFKDTDFPENTNIAGLINSLLLRFSVEDIISYLNSFDP